MCQKTCGARHDPQVQNFLFGKNAIPVAGQNEGRKRGRETTRSVVKAGLKNEERWKIKFNYSIRVLENDELWKLLQIHLCHQCHPIHRSERRPVRRKPRKLNFRMTWIEQNTVLLKDSLKQRRPHVVEKLKLKRLLYRLTGLVELPSTLLALQRDRKYGLFMMKD
jgi:hypothetical protein